MHNFHSMIIKLPLSYISMIILLIPYSKILKKYNISLEHRNGIIIFSFFVVTMFNVTGIPSIQDLNYNPNINLKLFRYFIKIFDDYLLNIILFIPFGFFVSSLWKYCQNLKKVFIYGFLLSLFIEISQIFGNRVTDINDIITNTLGSTIGYFFSTITKEIFPNTSNEMSLKTNLKYNDIFFIKYEILIIIFLCWISIFIIRPFLETLF